MLGYIWTRQSNKYDKAVYSLESQLDACREAARKDGVEVGPDREYVVKFSGRDLRAIPELSQLRNTLERNKSERKRIYCYAQDRLIRGEEAEDIFYLLVEFRHFNAEVRFLKNPLDLSTIAGKITTLIAGHEAAGEIDKIKDRTMRGKLQRVKEGKVWNHGLEKFGYRRIKDEGRAVFDPEEKAILEDMIERVFAGESARSIARSLNEQKIATPYQRKGRLIKGKPTQNTWRANAITTILRDPALKGEGTAMRYASNDSRIVIPDAYPPLLSPERWDELQVKLSEIAAKTSRARNGQIPLIFRGRIICQRCGRPMVAITKGYSTAAGETRQARAYACKHQDAPPCRPWSQIATRYVEEVGWGAIVEYFSPEALEALAARVETAPRENPNLGRRKALEDARAKKQAQQQNLITRLADASEIAAPAILRSIDEIGREIQNLGEQIERVDIEIRTDLQRARQTQDSLRSLARFARQFEETDFQGKRNFVEECGITLLWNPENRTLTLDSSIFNSLQ